MEKKPITTFLKVMSIITLIWCALGIVINALAVFVAPLAEENAGEPIAMMTWISIAVSAVCMIINFILAVMALQHKGIGMAYRISMFTMMAYIVFSVADGGGINGYLSALASAVIPILFAVSLAMQNKEDQK